MKVCDAGRRCADAVQHQETAPRPGGGDGNDVRHVYKYRIARLFASKLLFSCDAVAAGLPKQVHCVRLFSTPCPGESSDGENSQISDNENRHYKFSDTQAANFGSIAPKLLIIWQAFYSIERWMAPKGISA